MQFQKRVFERQEIFLDGNKYAECTFTRCSLTYGAHGTVVLVGCNFNDCSWQFTDAAARTVNFMQGLYHSSPGGKALIEKTIENIRKPTGQPSGDMTVQ